MPRPLTLATLAVAVLAVAVLAARRRVAHLVVAGHSMAPTLCPGDRLLVVRTGRRPRVGDLVVTSDPRAPDRMLIKRVHSVIDDRADVRGDNAVASTDSRTFGPLPLSAADACVVWRYHPPDVPRVVSLSRARGRRSRSRRAGPR